MALSEDIEKGDTNNNQLLLDYFSFLRCPDCKSSLKIEHDHLICCQCSRLIQCTGSTIAALPNNFVGVEDANEAAFRGGWRSRFVKKVFTRHNKSPAIVRAVKQVLSTLSDDQWGLNIGAGDTKMHPRLLNLDIRQAESVDILATVLDLPFQDDSFRVVISQEVFEHLPDPFLAAREVARVLQPGGLFYLQTPFIYGTHSLPHDYWRFTPLGLKQLITDAGLEVIETKIAVSAGTALYRIQVEYFATLMATIHRKLYIPTKAFAAMFCLPLKIADYFYTESEQHNRIPGGYYVIARKKN